jgi:hypothetical protein
VTLLTTLRAGVGYFPLMHERNRLRVQGMQARRRQQGVILLLVMLVILAAGSYVLLRALNVGASDSRDDEAVTRAALREAKRALINYSIYKPALNLGPGRLPCPDLTGDGVAAGSCVLGGTNKTTGRFPFATLDSPHAEDASGSELWYAVADSHRNFLTTPINSDTGDTTDDLSLDGIDGIVAIIIAPGATVGAQDRSSSPDISDFLEGDNASLGDASFTRIGADPFNDEVIPITRAELMVEVEKSVLGEVGNVLNDYFERYGGFPWASPFADPTSSAFDESMGATEGHLAIHEKDETFIAEFSLIWNVPSSGTLSSGGKPQDACMRWNECNDDDAEINYDFVGTSATVTGTCMWTNAEVFDCNGTGTATFSVDGGTRILERTYAISLDVSGVSTTTTAPTISPYRSRSRNFVLTGTMPPGSSGSVMISEKLDGTSRGAARTLTFGAGDAVTINFEIVPFLLGNDRDIVGTATNSPAALPRWFTDNEWHHLIYYAFSSSDSIGGSGCTPALDCLNLELYSTGIGVPPDVTVKDVKGVVIMAGAGSGRPSGDYDDYFEDENKTPGDGRFAKAPVSETFNDQVQILDPNE